MTYSLDPSPQLMHALTIDLRHDDALDDNNLVRLLDNLTDALERDATYREQQQENHTTRSDTNARDLQDILDALDAAATVRDWITE